MTRTLTRSALAALAGLAVLGISAATARAALITSTFGVSGPFSAKIDGTGNIHVNSASGTYQQGLIFGHTDIGLSAGAQNVPLTVTPATATNLPASGVVSMDYDDVTPGTPLNINSVNVDLNGAGGSNTNIPLTITSGTASITVGSLVPISIKFTINGNITDFRFDSTGAGAVSGGVFGSPGNFTGLLSGTVSATTTGLVSINLGTIATISPTPINFAAGVPGVATSIDLQGGLPPFPNDMQANFAVDLTGLSIPVPVHLPATGTQLVNYSTSLGNTASGLRTMIVNGTLDATINLKDPKYSLTGNVNQVLVPEPGSMVLAALAIVGLTFAGWRRRQVA